MGDTDEASTTPLTLQDVRDDILQQTGVLYPRCSTSVLDSIVDVVPVHVVYVIEYDDKDEINHAHLSSDLCVALPADGAILV